MAWRQFVLAGRQVSLAPGVSLNFESLPNSFDVWFYATDNGSPPAADLFVLTVNIGGACPTQSLHRISESTDNCTSSYHDGGGRST